MIFKSLAFKNILFCFIAVALSCSMPAQTDSIQKQLSFDFGITRGRNINAWPILKKYDDTEKSELQIIYPLFSKTNNYNLHSKHLHILPFVINDSSTKGIDKRFASLYYPSLIHIKKENDSITGTRSFSFLELAPNISGLKISRSAGGVFVDNNMFFFISYKKDLATNKTRFIVFPAYWYFSNKYKTTHLLFPVYYQKTHGTDKNVCIALTYYYHKSLYDKKTTLFPIWWKREYYYKGDTAKETVLFPIYWSFKNENRNNKVIFPLVYSFKDSRSRLLTVFPLFSSGKSSDSSRSHLVVTPFYWHLKQQDSKKDIVFPIYWNSTEYANTDTIKKTVLFPFYWSVKSKDENNKILFPLVYSFKDSTSHSFTAFPLFSHGKSADSSCSHLTITPFFWQLKEGNDSKNILFPIYWNSKEYLDKDTLKKTTLFPIYWSTKSKDRNYKVLFPLIYSIRDSCYRSFTVLPLFSVGYSKDSSTKHFEVLQIYWQLKTTESSTTIVFPLWLKNEQYGSNDTITRKILFPVYMSFKNKSKNVDIVLPFYFNIKDQYKSSVTPLPLFSYGRSSDSSRSYLAITPFYWHLNQKKGTRDILFPVVWKSTQYRNTDTLKTTVLFPLYWSAKSKEENYTVLFPLIFNIKNTSKQSFTVFPFYSKGRSSDSSKKYLAITPLYWHLERKHSKKDILFPIFWNTTHYLNKDTLKKTLLIPIYWSVKSKTENNKVLFPFVYSFKDSAYRSFSILPLFSKGQSVDSNRSHFAITPFYWHFNRPNYKQDIVFPLFWRTTSLGRLKNDTITRLYPFYWSKKSEDENNKILFPLIFSLKDKYYHSFTFFPLFSFGHNMREDNNYVMITPLAGFFYKPHKTQVFFFPVFSYKKEKDEVRSSAFLFLFRKTKKADYSKTSILWPICEHIRSGRNTSFRIAPLVWYKKTDSTKMFSIQPLFYSNKSTTKKTFILSFLLFKHENKIGYSVSNSVLWKVYHAEKIANGDFEKRFLHLAYANIHLDGKIEKSVFPFYHYSKNITGDVSKSVGLGFYNYFKRYIPEIKEFYEEERIFWFIRIRSNSEQLKSEGNGKYLKRK